MSPSTPASLAALAALALRNVAACAGATNRPSLHGRNETAAISSTTARSERPCSLRWPVGARLATKHCNASSSSAAAVANSHAAATKAGTRARSVRLLHMQLHRVMAKGERVRSACECVSVCLFVCVCVRVCVCVCVGGG